MDRVDLIDISAVVRENDWLVGAVNYDEDLHFSSYYLRASTPSGAQPFYPGYSCIIGFYEDLTERYYLLKRECKENAEFLVARALREPAWLPGLLESIATGCRRLEVVFPEATSPTLLRGMSLEALLSLYVRHHDCHTSLYRFARIPEALDRGVSHFTNYLVGHLQTKGLGETESREAFEALTQVVSPSILVQEILEFERIVDVARWEQRTSALLLSFPRRARMLLSPSLLSRIGDHVEKWKFVDYHGYGERSLRTVGDAIERLLTRLHESSATFREDEFLDRLARNRAERSRLFQEYKLDPPHRALFGLYPEIGALKLLRRYAQLRNFYFLDMLLGEIAYRLEVDEWSVRCMLPDEVRRALEAGRPVDQAAIRDRRNGCMYVLFQGGEHVWTGEKTRSLKAELHSRSTQNSDRRVLKGVVASKGRVRGTCKIVIRANDAKPFEKGSILVSESTDPDLLQLISIAGGVLTEQGGVTSHAAIICRELAVPTIIGIEGLLDSLRDGDVVEVDAYSGIVRPLADDLEPPEGLVIEPALGGGPDSIGNKAANLLKLARLGYRVPAFIVLRYANVVQLLGVPPGEVHTNLTKWVARRLSISEKEKVAIRSSAAKEDSDASSMAGKYRSVLNVEIESLWEGLSRFVRENEESPGGVYAGGIVVQKMVTGDLGGVCLTRDSRAGHLDALVIEVASTGADAVTSGRGRPKRVIVRRETCDILEPFGDGTEAPPPEVMRFVPQFLEIEHHFGRPVDIEWLSCAGELTLLQARPIVS